MRRIIDTFNYFFSIKIMFMRLKNKVFVYLFTRYFTYGLQFIMSLIIAVRLGPYYLGIYGYIHKKIS